MSAFGGKADMPFCTMSPLTQSGHQHLTRTTLLKWWFSEARVGMLERLTESCLLARLHPGRDLNCCQCVCVRHKLNGSWHCDEYCIRAYRRSSCGCSGGCSVMSFRDHRGFKGTRSLGGKVIAHQNPTLNSFRASRALGHGCPNRRYACDGSHLKCGFLRLVFRDARGGGAEFAVMWAALLLHHIDTRRQASLCGPRYWQGDAK